MALKSFPTAQCIALIVFLVIPVVSDADIPEKVAVLISPQVVTGDGVKDHTGFWNSLVLTYHTLKLNGFSDENIYVLYASGCPYRTNDMLDGGGNAIDIFDASRGNIKNLLSCLAGNCAGVLTGGCSFADVSLDLSTIEPPSDAILFVAWIGHGKNTLTDAEGNVVEDCAPCQDNCTNICDTYFKTNFAAYPICDCELPIWMTDMDPENPAFRRRAWVFSTCMAGGVVGDLTSGTDNTVVLASCEDDQPDYSINLGPAGSGLVVQREWMYLVDTALQQLVGPLAGAPADEIPYHPNDYPNNLVALDEAFNWSTGEVNRDDVDPVLGNPDKAKCIHLRLPDPSKDKEIFSMDHPYDWSMEPSDIPGVPWWEGPDLWVRNSCSCFDETHLEPLYGQTSYLCARVHNIGCDDLTDVEVKFSWVESTGWASPANWNAIGTATVVVESATSKKTPPVEWTDVPLPGSYCLHAVAEVADDMRQDDRANYDNNLTQINVSVLNVVGDTWSWWPFLIENWSATGAQQVDVMFNMAELADGTEFAVEFPSTVDATVSPGVTRSDFGGWTVLEFGLPARPSEIVRVNLEAGNRMRAILRMKLPENPTTPASAVSMVERVDDEQVGGIVFRARVAELEEVACSSLQTQAALFSELALASGHPTIAEEFQAIACMRLPCRLSDLVEVFASVQELYSDHLAIELGYFLLESPVYRDRYLAAAARFMAVNTENVNEQALRALVESAREQSLYAWLILGERNPN